MNDYGAGPAASSNAVTPYGQPFPPTNVQAVAGNGQATVTWTAAEGNGSAVTDYLVSWDPIEPPLSSKGQTSVTVTGLTNGQLYVFTVVAVNAAAMPWPSLLGSARFFITAIRPSTAPMMPSVGE